MFAEFVVVGGGGSGRVYRELFSTDEGKGKRGGLRRER